MTEENCTFFKKGIIEAIRWLPSAVNRQDYALLFKDHIVHVFIVGNSMCYLCDGGIAMAHVEIGCLGCGLNGHWELLKDICYKIPKNWKYLASFVLKNNIIIILLKKRYFLELIKLIELIELT